MLNQILDKAESTVAAVATNPEQPAPKKLKTKDETATCFDKDPISGLNQRSQKQSSYLLRAYYGISLWDCLKLKC